MKYCVIHEQFASDVPDRASLHPEHQKIVIVCAPKPRLDQNEVGFDTAHRFLGTATLVSASRLGLYCA